MAKKQTKKAAPKSPEAEVTVVARNRRARHDYHLELTLECGLMLRGSEVKSLREGKASLDQAFARIDGDEVWLLNANIPEYGAASFSNHRPQARRKLLLHRREIVKLQRALQGSGRTLIPLQIHFNDRGFAKVMIAVGLGKKQHDKREDQAKRDAQREMDRARKR